MACARARLHLGGALSGPICPRTAPRLRGVPLLATFGQVADLARSFKAAHQEQAVTVVRSIKMPIRTYRYFTDR